MHNLAELSLFLLSAGGFVALGYLLGLRRSSSGPTAGVDRPPDPPGLAPQAAPAAERAAASTLDARYLFVSFEEEIRRARERALPMTLLALSLENHPDRSQGPTDSQDRLLRSVAHAVRGQMRGCDTCIRYAASEFILILPGVSREEARKVEGRLRVALQGVSRDDRQGSVKPRVTLGSATFPEEGASFDQLLTLADSRRRRDGAAALAGAPAQRAAAPFRVPPPTLSRN